MSGDFSAEFDGETARLCIQHVYPEDEGEYTCVAYNDLGKAFTSACLIVDGNFAFVIVRIRKYGNVGDIQIHGGNLRLKTCSIAKLRSLILFT